jgi:2,4-diketo-3-deoxy-L-fuconate hydrolase
LRICRFDGGYGLLDGDDIVDITGLVAPGGGLGDALIAALPGLRGAATGARRRPLGSVDMLSPVASPTKILAAPNNYRAHTAEMQADAAASGAGRAAGIHEAGFFLKATTSLVGPSEGIAQRFLDRRTDHEVELVAVIGRRIDRPLDPGEALGAVAGYSLGLDITLRGPEERSLRKSIDTYTVLGPYLVTADEVPDVPGIHMRLSVNGEVRQSTPLSDMVVDVGGMVAYASRFYTLYPGDLIYTGSPAGVGPITPGDLLHAEATGLGSMDVRVRAAEPP